MKKFDMEEGGHKWEKQNLVTQSDRNGCYDIYKCANCGVVGKSYHMGEITVTDRMGYRIPTCKKLERKKQVKVTHCRAVGRAFGNLVDGSVHDVIMPPAGQDDSRGEWVMGVGEPVLLLFSEFNYVEQEGGQQ